MKSGESTMQTEEVKGNTNPKTGVFVVFEDKQAEQ
jgi:hypothetical protein